jgi:hypothetical protein
MSFFPVAAPAPASPLAPLSRALFLLRLDRASLGDLTASTGHVAQLTRAATLAVVDRDGASVTLPPHVAGFEPRDWDGDGVREALGLRMETDDRLIYDGGWQGLGAEAGLIEWVETGNATGATLLRVGGDTGAHLRITRESGGYRVRYDNGTDAASVTFPGLPATGQRVRVSWQIDATGGVSAWQSLDGTGEVAVGPVAGPTGGRVAYAASPKVRINHGPTGAAGTLWVRRVLLVAGTPTLARLLSYG